MNKTWLGLMIIIIGTFIAQGLYLEVSMFYVAGYIIATIAFFVFVDYAVSKVWQKIRKKR